MPHCVAKVVLVLIILLVIYLGGGFGAGGQLLTFTKPTGGTLSAAGIRCGARGATPSRNPGGETLTLLAFNINPDGVAAVLRGAPAKTQ